MSKQYLSHLFAAAKTALINPRYSELTQWIGTGPSIRARARLALIAAFLVAVPTLFIGVMRTDSVTQYATTLSLNEQFRFMITNVRLKLEHVRSALWRYEAQPEMENESLLLYEINDLREHLAKLIASKPKEFQFVRFGFLSEMSIKLENSVVNSLKKSQLDGGKLSRTNMTFAMLSLTTLSNEVFSMEKQVDQVLMPAQQSIIDTLSKVGRDQLILFLILLLAIPIFIGFVPSWLVVPLMRLKNIEQWIEQGKIRNLGVSGRDEISGLARALRGALMWREELDQRKSAKIFEIRNVLRSVISHVAEPILIIDRSDRINYANDSAAALFDVEVHYLEGSGLGEHVFAPDLEQALEDAKNGDVKEEGIVVLLEMSRGHTETVLAYLSVVHERQGGISRVVIVFEKPNSFEHVEEI